MTELSITELFNINIIQQIQDTFSMLTGLAAIITDPDGKPVTKESGFTDLCLNYTRRSKLGLSRCMECDKMGAIETLKRGKPYTYKCHMGLYNYAAPIMVEDKVIGCIIGGQAMCDYLDDESLRNTAVELGIEPADYIKAARKLVFEDRSRVDNAAQCLFVLANAVSAMSYCNYLSLKKIEETERNVTIKSNYVTRNLITDLKATMTSWLSTVRTLFENFNGSNGEEIKKQLITEGEKVYYSIVNNADDKKEGLSLGTKYTERLYDIRQLVGRLTDEAEKICSDKGLEFSCCVDEGVPRTMFGDDETIGFIIDFILAEFIAYTENGDINLSISSEKNGYSEVIIIKLSDSGVPMTPERVEEIVSCLSNYNFESDSKRTDRADYSYIGILLRNISGSISVESDGGKGIAFTIKLPQLNVKE